MFETAVGDGPQEFILEKEISKARRMYADIAAFALLSALATNGQVALLSYAIACSGRSGGWDFGCVELLVGVVDEVFFSRHVDGSRGDG